MVFSGTISSTQSPRHPWKHFSTVGTQRARANTFFGWRCSRGKFASPLSGLPLDLMYPRWTRGTGVIPKTNALAHELESYGVHTFSAREMAFNVLDLMLPLLFGKTQVEPIWAETVVGSST
jgi:hypothetical protein